MQRNISVSDICEHFALKYCGADVIIDGLNLCNRVSEHMHVLTYVTNGNYVDVVRNNPAIVGIVIREQDMASYQHLTREREISFVVCDEPEKLFYDIHDYLYYHKDFYDKYDFESIIGESCKIHPSAVIERGVVLGSNIVIGMNSVVRRGTIIGDDCSIGCNTTIGSEGFQIIKINNVNRKIVHVGGVRLGENVSIGDNVTVCNSLFENTAQIGNYVMIDNLSYIGHNVVIGDNAVITAGTSLCGSAIIESGAWIGVNSTILNRVIVGSDSKVGAGSVVTRDIPQKSLAYGVPARVK